MRLFNSIRRKIRLCIGIAFVGFILATAFTLFSQIQLKRYLEEIRDLDFHLALSSTELLNTLRHQSRLYEESFLFGLPDSAEEANLLSVEIIALLEKMAWLSGQNHRLHTYQVKPTDDLKKKYLDYFGEASRIYPILAQGADPTRYLEEIQNLSRRFNALAADMDTTRTFYSHAFQRDIDSIIRLAGQKNSLLIGFYLILLLGMSLLVNWVAHRVLVRPLGKIKEAVRCFGRGERPQPWLQTMDPEDEIGELGAAFLHMTENLERTTVSKAYVDSILKNMSDSLVVVDTEFRIRTVNQAALTLLECCEAELIGRHIRDILDDFRGPEESPGGLSRATLRSGVLRRNLETTVRTREGSEVPVLLSTSVFFGANNDIQGLVYVAKDITERIKAQEEQRRQHEFLLNVFESISHPFYVINVADYRISLFNNAANEQGMRAGTTCHFFSHGLDQPCSADHPCPVQEVVRTGRPAKVEHTHGERIVEVYGHPIFDEDGRVIQMIGYSLDITHRKKAEQKLEQLAQKDFLTGLGNRMSFHEQLQRTVAGARKNAGGFGLMYLDLDRFKIINDSLGHAFGDILLQTVARRITGCMRDTDLIARLGGDEFAVVLPRMANPRDLANLAERLLEILATPFQHEGEEIFTSASIGIAIFPDHGQSMEEVLKNADDAMYKAKQGGGNAFRFAAGPGHQPRPRLRLASRN